MTATALTILVVGENRLRTSIIEDGLREAGHGRVTVVQDVAGIARAIETIAPDVVVVDLENPDRAMQERVFRLARSIRRPIAMFVDRADAAAIDAAVDAGVSAYVVDGLRKERIKPILDTALSRFNAFARVARELDEARMQLSDRKSVERAKGALMKRRGLSEEQAYALMRRQAMNENRRIADIARSLITAADLLGEEDGR